MKTPYNDSGQVFFNSGKGFNETESVRFDQIASEEFQTYRVKLPGKQIYSLRIDPLIGEGEFAVRSIRIKNRVTEVVIKQGQLYSIIESLNQVDIYYQDEIIQGISTGGDPHFILDYSALNNRLPLQVSFIVLVLLLLLVWGLKRYLPYQSLFNSFNLFVLFIAISYVYFYYNLNHPILLVIAALAIIVALSCGSHGLKIINTSHSGFEYEKFVIALIIIGFFTLTLRLGYHNFREDEYLVIGAAAGYLFTGQFSIWDWLSESLIMEYQRAWPHTWLVANSFKILSISEWSSRIVSVFFGLVFYIVAYPIGKFFTGNKNIALLFLFTLVFNPSYLDIFRLTRMYALLLPLFLIMAYTFYRGLTEELTINIKYKKLNTIVNKYLNFNYYFLIASVLLLYLTYLIHINALVILPAAYIYVLIMAFLEKKKKYLFLSFAGAILFVILLFYKQLGYTGSIFYLLSRVLSFISIGETRAYAFNYSYLDSLFQYPFGLYAGCLLAIFLIFLVFNKKQLIEERTKRYIYLYTIVIFSLIFFIFFADRYASFVYIAHITPFSIILIIVCFWYISEKLLKYSNQIKIVFVLIAFVVITYYNALTKLYGNDHIYGNFQEAYQVIIDNYNCEEEVIFGQYLRTFYLRDLVGAKTIDMLYDEKYAYHEFMQDLDNFEAGWLTWETRKDYHINPEIVRFIDKNFIKYHGKGIDDTKVEVYYYNQDLLNKANHQN